MPIRPGETWVRDEDLLAAWGPEVGVALLTWVTSTASHRCDLRALAAHGRAMGSLVGVDITQGVGILPFDLAALRADFVVLDAQVVVRRRGRRRAAGSRDACCRNAARNCAAGSARRILSLGAGFSSSTRATRGGSITARRRFFACAACLPALDWHAQQDAAALLSHNRRMVEAVIDGCAGLGLELVSPAKAENAVAA